MERKKNREELICPRPHRYCTSCLVWAGIAPGFSSSWHLITWCSSSCTWWEAGCPPKAFKWKSEGWLSILHWSPVSLGPTWPSGFFPALRPNRSLNLWTCFPSRYLRRLPQRSLPALTVNRPGCGKEPESFQCVMHWDLVNPRDVLGLPWTVLILSCIVEIYRWFCLQKGAAFKTK